MATTSMPFSAIAKLKEDDTGEDGEPKKKTREEWKKAKELEEARKAGTVPAAVDEEGKDINPHIPQYIATAPWYFGSLGPTLKHQRPQPEKEKHFNVINEHYTRGLRGSQATKYRKGACENCGGMGHKKKECFERPRKVGAKYLGVNICPDDVDLPKLALDYDGKRDRWNGFDPGEYTAVVEEHQKVEEFKRQIKAQKLKEGQDVDGDNEDDEDNDDDDDDDDEKYAENIDMPGTKVDSKQRITVRNLRIREDTAKYLRNLDPDSAYYDPKTRSMRDNPYDNTGKTPEEVDYAGENFIRFTGDTVSQAKAQLFAWEAYEKGVDVSLQAEPTKLEILKKEFLKRKDEFKNKVSDDLLDKYGGKEHLEAPPKELLLAQTENYVEYSRQGKIIKGAEKEIVRSKYEEDVFPLNHASVWGSYWKDGRWGYKCCHSFIKNSYCTGEAGKETSDVNILAVPSQEQQPALEIVDEDSVEKTLLELHQEKIEKKKLKKKNKKRKLEGKKTEDSSSSSESSSSDSESELSKEELRKKKLRQALIKAKLEEDRGKAMLEKDDRQRSYNSMYEQKTLTEEEIEAYQIRRIRPEDPMANFM
ncbi:UNVERIFIED_CONTAM: hypothetical protein RMT77_016040 [Armadillidium vulgare]